MLPPSFILQLNNRCPIAAHEAVSLKKICCFFCAHFWQIEKVSVLISEQGEIPVFYQAAGKTQLLKRLIVGKDQAAGKVFARKRGRTPARSLLWKNWLRFPEKVAVGSERQTGSFLEQDSTAVPNFAYRSFCPCGNLVGECLPQTLLWRLKPLEKFPQILFGLFQKQFRYTPRFSPISERTPRTERRSTTYETI